MHASVFESHPQTGSVASKANHAREATDREGRERSGHRHIRHRKIDTEDTRNRQRAK